MANKIFTNPNMLSMKDPDNEVTVEVTFHLTRDDTKFATVTIIEDEPEETVAIFDITEDTLRAILESGWHWGATPPPEWTLDGNEEMVPPGTMVH